MSRKGISIGLIALLLIVIVLAAFYHFRELQSRIRIASSPSCSPMTCIPTLIPTRSSTSRMRLCY